MPSRAKICPRCQQPAPIEAQFCANCKHQFRTRFTSDTGAGLSAQRSSIAPLPPVQSSALSTDFCHHCGKPLPNGAAFCPACATPISTAAYPTAAYSNAAPYSVPNQYVNVQVQAPPNNAGWWAAVFVLFGTPLGWVLLPVLFIAVMVCLVLGVTILPIVIGVIVAIVIAISRLPVQHKMWAIPLAILLGFGINSAMWHSVNNQLEPGPPTSTNNPNGQALQ